MNYKKLIVDKNLTIEQLPKRLQKKIDEIENVAQRVEELSKLNLDETEKDLLFEAQVKVSSLDREIEKAVRKFNPFVYKKKLEHIARVNEQKLKEAESLEKAQTKYIKETEQVEQEEVEEVEEPDTQDLQVIEDEHVQETQVQEPQHEEQDYEETPIEDESDHFEQRLKDLRSKVHIKPESFVVEEPSYEAQEFDRVGASTPKKMSKGLILMGVGAFLLTWGAVNFFKERRG